MKYQKATNSNWVALAFLLLTSSCVKNIDDYKEENPDINPITDVLQLNVPANFNYETDRDVSFNIVALTNTNQPLANVVIKVMSDSPENNGSVYYEGATDAGGNFNASIRLPKTVEEVIINSDYIGLSNNVIANTTSNFVSLTLGSSNPNRVKTKSSLLNTEPTSFYRSAAVPTKNYLGTWLSNGKPNYLVTLRDTISSDLLNRINASLPERRPVPTYHPEYIDNLAQTNIVLNNRADLWMTFVHEGAGYLNTVGYYLYNKNSPPSSTNDLADIKIVFPNFSYSNSGGGLVSGDKVYLGNFGADTTIGFVLLANAYCNNQSYVCNGNGQYYSDDLLNPESNSNKRPHTALLWDSISQKLIIGFEDLYRNSDSDDDFNDAIFYVSAYPASAINRNNVVSTNTNVDSDGDGVSDLFDNFPSNANAAYQSYYPASNDFGYLGFEDLWPYRGDFDFNDLQVGYRFNPIRNASNLVTQINMKLFVRAVGGSYQNGFGIELPIPSAYVQSVTGTNLKWNYINRNANGTEANQTKAVIIPFDNALNLVTRPSGYYVNTEPGAPIMTSDTLNIVVTLSTPVSLNALGNAPYNPFLINNSRRGYEVHLADKTPTNLADQTLLNTGNDKSNAALGRYYKSDKNLPWALNIPASFPTIKEKSQIINGYLKFQGWAQSGGLNNTDWYLDLPGYRDNNYHHH